MIVDSTNPRIMADNIREIARNGGGSDLPEVTSADNGKVLGVVEGSWNKMDAPAGGVNYSTTEQDTGLKWIDGKTIYQKTVVKSDSITSGVDNAVLHGIDNIDEVIDYDAVMIETSGYSTKTTVPVASVTSAIDVNATYAAFVNFVGKTDFLYTMGNVIVNQVSKIVVTIYYTKITTTKSKKKTTKGEN